MSPAAARKRPRPKRGRKDRERQRAWLWPLLLLLLAMLTAFLAVSCGKQSGAVAEVPRSTQRRARLESGSVRETAYITDRLGWLEENRGPAEAGLRYFYRQSGVQPHLYLRGAQPSAGSVDRDSMNGYAAALYGSLFSDEGHLLIFLEEEERSGSLRWGFAWGKQAAAVLDPEAQEILRAYWDILLADSAELADGQKAAAIEEALKRSADNIMMVQNTGGWIWFLGILLGGILLLGAWEFRKNWVRLKTEDKNP